MKSFSAFNMGWAIAFAYNTDKPAVFAIFSLAFFAWLTVWMFCRATPATKKGANDE